jgi:hypothetical protein
VLGKVKSAQANSDVAPSPTEVDAAKEQEKEIRKLKRNRQATVARAGLVRAFEGQL